MKSLSLLFIGIFMLFVSSFSQDFMVNNHSNKNLLYIGYNNHVSFHQIGCKYVDYELEGVNCEIAEVEDQDAKDFYLIRVDRTAYGKMAKVYFKVNDEVVDSTLFEVQVMPVPYLFWGHHKAGSKFSNLKNIEVKYDIGVVIDHAFQIIGWECKVQDQVFKGEGSILSDEVIEFSNSLNASESLLITVTYVDSDGVTRKMAGSWNKA